MIFRFWEYDYGIEGETCVNKQPDGTCERIYIPDCEDRTVYCNNLRTPDDATKTLLEQPNHLNERERGTKVKFECPTHGYYFNYAVPPAEEFVSYFYTKNLDYHILECNEFG